MRKVIVLEDGVESGIVYNDSLIDIRYHYRLVVLPAGSIQLQYADIFKGWRKSTYQDEK